ncbi:MAG: flagellar basal-body rod protein FlgF [bacterium]|nr:flagellar basal-body rod protein FlgF [bacterium]
MDSIFSLMSALKGQQRQMDAVANNLANVNTPGYKKDTVLFKEVFNEYSMQDLESEQESFSHEQFISPLTRSHSSFVAPDHVAARMSNGKMTPTQNPFDLSLQKSGFFTVEGEHGTAYTRNGRFMQDAQGYLITNGGEKVLGENGPIKIDGKSFAVGRDGSVMVDNQKVDRLKIANFEQPDRLTKLGNSLWVPGSDAQVPIPQSDVVIHQGIYEGSNVETVEEMVEMITLNRHYEAAQKALKSNDELSGQVINIARV